MAEIDKDAATSQSPKPLTPEAERALAEAEARRRARSQTENDRAPEAGGQKGPDPVRFGDWEKGGICWDF